MTSYEAVALAIASAGAILGIMNTWHRMSRDEVRLKITPAHALPVGPSAQYQWTFSIEFVNLSAFPVTVTEVGLRLRGTKVRLALPQPITADGGLWRRRLESRDAVTVPFDPRMRRDPQLAEVRSAYAKTRCGTVRYGTSGALKQLVKEAPKGREDR